MVSCEPGIVVTIWPKLMETSSDSCPLRFVCLGMLCS